MLYNASLTYVMCQNMYRAFQRLGLLLLVLTFHRLIMNAFPLVIAGLRHSIQAHDLHEKSEYRHRMTDLQ
jgi:hypothetical protein